MGGKVGKNLCKCTAVQASLSYHLQTEKNKKIKKIEMLLTHGASDNSDLCCDQSCH